MPSNTKGQYGYIPGTKIPSMGRYSPNIGAGIYARLIGTRNITEKLSIALAKVEVVTIEGLRAAGAFIIRETFTVSPTVPIDTGALRGSWFVEDHPQSTIKKPMVIVGFGGDEVNYAVYVHEMTEPPYENINWSVPGSGPKFLEYAVKRNIKKIVSIVGSYVKGATK